MDNKTQRLGVRKHVYQPNMIWPWVFRQGEVWVDVEGSEHTIHWMPFDEVEQAISFCRRQAERIRGLCYIEWVGRGFEFKLHGVPLDGALALAGVKPDLEADPQDWMEATPLLRALIRRLALANSP